MKYLRKHERFYIIIWIVLGIAILSAISVNNLTGYYIAVLLILFFIAAIIGYRQSPIIQTPSPEPKSKFSRIGIYVGSGLGEIGSLVRGLFFMVFVGFCIWGCLYLLLGWGEKEGVIDYSSCRQVVKLSPDTMEKYFYTFVGSDMKTQSGQIIGGEFVRIEMDDSYPVHLCAKAYIYDPQQPPNVCLEDPTRPYLGYDDKCYDTKYSGAGCTKNSYNYDPLNGTCDEIQNTDGIYVPPPDLRM
jgi:hypothetical protein